MSRQYGSRLALVAIVTVFLRGLLGAWEFSATVRIAAAAAIVFFILGLAVAEIARRLIEEHVRGSTGDTADS